MLKIKNCKEIRLQTVDDGMNGFLTVAENLRQVPFEIKRVYTITNLRNKNAVRGQHAHHKLEQVLFSLHGSCEIALDDGVNKGRTVLDRPNVGLYIGPDLWHTLQGFSDDCVLMILASALYDQSDYIRDYQEFLRHAKTGSGKR